MIFFLQTSDCTDESRLFPNYGSEDTPSPSLPLRSGHLDIKDTQCAKKMMSVQFHIKSYCVWRLNSAIKFQLFSKVAKFVGYRN